MPPALALIGLIRCRRQLAGLTLVSAYRWALVALTASLLAVALRLLPGVSPRTLSAVQYLSATLLLVPLIDVLGARNPGHRAWPWFVLLPLVLVLQWPAITQLTNHHAQSPIEIPSPTMLGFVLVLLMGAGNYFGTSNSMACLFGAGFIFLFAVPVTEWSEWPGDPMLAAASGCLTVAVIRLIFWSKHLGAGGDVQQLWVDFRDLYGMVWARRVIDRVNQFADREDWSVQLTLDGFQPRKTERIVAVSTDRPGEGLRWVLRRFADDTFLARYRMTGFPVDDSPHEQQHSRAD